MSTDRFDRALPDLLEQLAPRAVPDYRDDIVRQTARMRQRPAWTFPERWLPVSVITSRALTAPPVRWRIVGLVALLLLALAVGLAIVAGSQRHVPAPFGPAANGVVAYEAGGDIFTADPVTGVAKAVVSGTQMDLRPVFSRDGTHMVFERAAASETIGRLVVARSDGSDPVVVTPDPLTAFDTYAGSVPSYTFSPGGTEIALWSYASGELWIAKADGSGVRPVDLHLKVGEVAYAPLNGAELIVAGIPDGGSNSGIYAVDVKTGASTTIVAPAAGVGVDFIRVSPGGSRLAYVSSVDSQEQGPGPEQYRVHVVGLDGTNDLTLQLPAGATFQDSPAWSNDGTRLAITRGYAQHNEDMALAVVPADGSTAGHESAHGLTGCCNTILQWSPDDTSILVMPDTNLDGVSPEYLLLDPSTGTSVPAPWTGSSPPAWQRVVR
jgi:Tol biopolymer transport system component